MHNQLTMIPSRSRLVATRYYYGDGTVCRGDSVVMTRFGGGYFDGAGKPYFELADYQGNITTVIRSDGAIVSHAGFYPYGQPWRRPGELQWLYGGKEWLGVDGRDEYDFHARRQYPHLGIFTTPDPHAESYHDISPYAYCAVNPIMFIDPMGNDYWSTSDPQEIARFYSAVINGDKFFDFRLWDHSPDNEFIQNLVYNDETHKFYYSYAKVIDGELTVIGKQFDAQLKPVMMEGGGYPGAYVYEPITDIYNIIIHYLEDDLEYVYNGTHWKVNLDGRITGLRPICGTPPIFGKGKLWGGKAKMGRAICNMSGNREVQKEQIDALVAKYKLTRKQRAILHREISHEGMSYHEIEEFIKDYFFQ